MLTEATKKYRDLFAFGLLGVAALVLLSGLSLMFKSGDDLGGAGFADKALVFGPLFTSAFIIAPLVFSVVIVSVGEATKNAKVVVLAALGIGGVAALFAVITWFASYGVDETTGSGFGGVPFAGKIVGTFLNLASVIMIALALLFFVAVFQRFPKPVPAQQQWGQPGQQWGQPGQQWGQPGQQQWGGYGAAGAASSGWGDQAQAQAQQQGQPASAWGQQAEQAPQQGWGDSGQQGWSDSGQQGWGDTSQQRGWGDTGQQRGWGDPGQQQAWGQTGQQQAWGQAGQEQASGWGQPEESSQPQWGTAGTRADAGRSEAGDSDAGRSEWGQAETEQPAHRQADPWRSDQDQSDQVRDERGADDAEQPSGSGGEPGQEDAAADETQGWGDERSFEPQHSSDQEATSEQQDGDEQSSQKGWWQQ